MLNVETYVSNSIFHGLGLFAKNDIQQGEIIWTYNQKIDHSYTIEEWNDLKETLSSPSFKTLQNFAYKERDKYFICSDNAQYMNHHAHDYNVKNSKDLNTMYALRNISKDEELLYNYFESSDKDDFHLKFL